MLSFDLVNFIFMIINVLILFFIAKKFLFGRVDDIIKKREEEIADSYKAADKATEEALTSKKEYEDKIQSAEKEKAEIISDAARKADTESSRIIGRANEEADKIIKAANDEADNIRKAAEIVHDFRDHEVLVFLLEIIPLGVHVVVRHLQQILDVVLVRAVEHGRGDVDAEHAGRQAQMGLQDLSDVHTAGNAQGVQHDVQRRAVREEGHIFFRKNSGNDTLVSVTASHFVANGDFTLLCQIAADFHIDTCTEFGNFGIGIIIIDFFASLEGLDTDNDTAFTVRHFQRVVADFAGFFAENCAQ